MIREIFPPIPYLVVKALMMPLDLSEKVGFGLMSGPIRSGESSMSNVAKKSGLRMLS